MLQRLFQRFVSVSDRPLLMMRLDTQRRQVHLPSQPYSLRRKSNDPDGFLAELEWLLTQTQPASHFSLADVAGVQQATSNCGKFGR